MTHSPPPASRWRRAGTGAVGLGGRVRGFLSSGGAAESGLARLVELHLVATAADAAVTVALAGTAFALPTGQARGAVGLFLALTMAPFLVLAPLVGPVLDRFPHGRRWAIGGTLALRAFLAWVCAGVLVEGSPWLFPVALAILVASKAYAVSRAAAVPLLLPAPVSLVEANSRVSLAGLVGMVLGGGLALPVSRIGPQWALRTAFVLYVVATVLAIRLTDRVDSPAPGQPSPATTEPTVVLDCDGNPVVTPPAPPPLRERAKAGVGRRWRRYLAHFPDSVRALLWAGVGSRVLSGFLTVHVVFLAREAPPSGWSTTAVLGALGAGAGVGTWLGTCLGHQARSRAPESIGLGVVAAAILVVVAVAFWPTGWAMAGIGVASGLASQLVKLCLDAVVQRDVGERSRARVFGWTETWLQTGWVCGGALGIALPTREGLALGVVAGAVALCLGLGVRRART